MLKGDRNRYGRTTQKPRLVVRAQPLVVMLLLFWAIHREGWTVSRESKNVRGDWQSNEKHMDILQHFRYSVLTIHSGRKDRLDCSKTINVCQNPLTVRNKHPCHAYRIPSPPYRKNPSLRMRRARQILEWELYGTEIA